MKTKDDFSLKCVLAQHKLIINKISSNILNISWIVECLFNSAVLHFDHSVSPKICEWVKYSCYCESVHLTDHTWSWWNKPVTVQRDSATLNIIIKVSIFILTDENQNRSTESFTCQAVNTWTLLPCCSESQTTTTTAACCVHLRPVSSVLLFIQQIKSHFIEQTLFISI